MGVAWGDYMAGRRQHKVVRDKRDESCLCECDGRVFGGLANGVVVVWDASTLEERQVLMIGGEVSDVRSLAVCGDVVISGHGDGSLLVWNTLWNKATGRCDQVLRGHTAKVTFIVSWEQYLVSGSDDGTIRVWERGGAGSWPCLGTVAAYSYGVRTPIVWNGGVISGSSNTIVVHNIASRQHEANLFHNGSVCALALSGEKLFSTGDRTICEWALSTWESLRTIRVHEHAPNAAYPLCLAMSGSMLVCGGYRNDRRQGFVLVLDTEAMRCEHTLRLDGPVESLLSLRGEVWGVLSRRDGNTDRLDKVVAWGKAELGAGASEAVGS